jgi:hypothetical protein
MDVFDGHDVPRGSRIPNDGDSWNYSSVGPNPDTGNLEGKLPLVYSPYGYLDRDSHLDRVALDVSGWLLFAQHVASGLKSYGQEEDKIDDLKIYTGLARAMSAQGETWCDACRVLALHAPERKGRAVRELLETCVEDPLLISALAPPPVSVGTVDADTCSACPAGQGTLMDGTCGVCSVDMTIDASSISADSQSLDTMTSASGDTCPELFVLDIENLPSLPAGLTGIAVQVGPTNLLSPTCEQLYSFEYERRDASGAVVNSQSLSGTGDLVDCPLDGSVCVEDCKGLPSMKENAPIAFAKMRFHVPAQPNSSVHLSVGEEDDGEIIH